MTLLRGPHLTTPPIIIPTTVFKQATEHEIVIMGCGTGKQGNSSIHYSRYLSWINCGMSVTQRKHASHTSSIVFYLSFKQRKQYKLFNDNKRSSITKERIIMLEKIGFAWNAQVAAWQRRLKELEAFKEEHGTCTISFRC
jgi:hypothetical protein